MRCWWPQEDQGEKASPKHKGRDGSPKIPADDSHVCESLDFFPGWLTAPADLGSDLLICQNEKSHQHWKIDDLAEIEERKCEKKGAKKERQNKPTDCRILEAWKSQIGRICNKLEEISCFSIISFISGTTANRLRVRLISPSRRRCLHSEPHWNRKRDPSFSTSSKSEPESGSSGEAAATLPSGQRDHNSIKKQSPSGSNASDAEIDISLSRPPSRASRFLHSANQLSRYRRKATRYRQITRCTRE